MAGRARMQVGLVMTLAMLAGCASPSAPASTGAATQAVGNGGASTSAGTAVPSGDPNLARLVDAASRIGSVDDVAAAENRIVDTFAQTSGLITGLGADTWAFTNELAHEELAKAGEGIVLTGERALVASLEKAGPPRVAVAGAAGIGLAFATALISTGISSGSFNTPLNSTGSNTVNGETTTGRVSGHINYSASGSQVTADVEIGVDVTVTNANTGATLRTGNFRSQGKIKLDFCPDPNGTVKGHISVAISGGTSGAGSASIQIDADVEGTVGEDAVLHEIGVDGSSTQTTTPSSGSARTLTTSTNFRAPVGRGGSIANIVTGQATGQSITQGPGDLTQAEADAAAEQIGSASGAALYLIGEYAQKKWQGGECVEIRSTEQSRQVRKNETVQFETTVWHKIDGTQLNKKIVNQFSGKASIDPVGIEVPSPVTNSLKAGSQNGDKGTIEMTTTSNRGIGKLTLTFEVKGGWFIDEPSGGGRIHGQKCGDPPGDWVIEGTYDMMGMVGQQQWTITIDASGQTGTFTYHQESEGNPGGGPVKVHVSGDAGGTVALTIDPVDGNAIMTFTETYSTYTAGGASSAGGINPPYKQEWQVGGTC